MAYTKLATAVESRRMALCDLRQHRAECAHWDYEENNCTTCDRLEEAYKASKEQVERMQLGNVSR